MLKFNFPPGPGFFSRKIPQLDQSYNLTRDGDYFTAVHPEKPSEDYAHTPITTQATIALSATAVQNAFSHLDVSQLKKLKVYRHQIKFPDKVPPLPGDDIIRYMTYNPQSRKFGYSEKLCQLTVSPENERGTVEADVWGAWTVDPREFDILELQAKRGEEPVLRQGELRKSSGIG
jgi:hypothetical protein